MKKFLEALSKAQDAYSDSLTNDKGIDKLADVRRRYTQLIGKRALYTSKVSKECMVVRIESVTDDCVFFLYRYYNGRTVKTIRTSCTLASLFCREDVLEVEGN